MNKIKFEPKSTYFTISIFIIIIILAGAVLIKIVFSWNTFSSGCGRFIKIISPFLIGLLLAYFINPLVNFLNNTFLLKWLHLKKSSLRKILSIFISYFIILSFIILSIIYILPQIVTSLMDIIYITQDVCYNLVKYIENLETSFPRLNFDFLNNVMSNAVPSILVILKGLVTDFIPMLYNTSISIISWVINIFIALIVSCYILYDKRRILLGIKRVIYALFSQSKAESIINTLKDCNLIFSRFLSGKIIDSLIVGIICLILMNILHLPYALLISVILSISNLIPYFGPLIGSIPGILIMLMFGIRFAVIFAILVLIIQQADALFIEPKILGNSIGLRPMWIIFAITVGGSIGGPLGMFLGVPCAAVIACLCEKFISTRLTQKKLTHLINTKQQKRKGPFLFIKKDQIP